MIRSASIAQRPLLVGGMHRSGTSLTASLVASAGIDLGPELLGANASNPLGHFEDLGIQEFHRRCLKAHGLGDEGYTATASGVVPPSLEPDADALLEARMRPGVAWGWKEPRTTLFLDFWQERLPHARHLFVFRRPWEVADSLFRRGDGTFIVNPMFAFDVWTHYNRLILDFVRRHQAHSAVFEITQVIGQPRRVFDTVRERLGVALGRHATRYRDEYFTSDAAPTRAALVRSVAPEAWEVYLELRDLAGADDDIELVSSRSAALGDFAVLEWARASRAATEVRVLTEQRHQQQQRQHHEVRGERRRRSVRDRLSRTLSAVHRLFARPQHVAPQPVAVPPEAPAATPDIRPFPRAADLPEISRAA